MDSNMRHSKLRSFFNSCFSVYYIVVSILEQCTKITESEETMADKDTSPLNERIKRILKDAPLGSSIREMVNSGMRPKRKRV